jgi:hypothetical protein
MLSAMMNTSNGRLQLRLHRNTLPSGFAALGHEKDFTLALRYTRQQLSTAISSENPFPSLNGKRICEHSFLTCVGQMQAS